MSHTPNALVRIYRALLRKYRAILGIHRALWRKDLSALFSGLFLRRCRALLRGKQALWRVYRALSKQCWALVQKDRALPALPSAER